MTCVLSNCCQRCSSRSRSSRRYLSEKRMTFLSLLSVTSLLLLGTFPKDVQAVSPKALRSRENWIQMWKNKGMLTNVHFDEPQQTSEPIPSTSSAQSDQRFAGSRVSLRRNEETTSAPPREAMSFHRCKFVGIPKVLKRPKDMDWNGHGWRFGHEFVPEECSGGLPAGDCFSGFHGTYHCGRDEQWKIRADNKGVEWTNWHPCTGGIANVTVDFVCVADSERAGTIHRCSFEGEPEPLRKTPKNAPPKDESREGTAAAGSGGWFRHRLTGADCSNGWPSDVSKCVVGLRDMKHCGGDHDWSVNVRKDDSADVTWYTSYKCDWGASVGVDIFCPAAADPIHCEFSGSGYEQHPKCPVTMTERHANEPMSGACLRHEFGASECVVGRKKEKTPAPDKWYENKVCLGVLRSGQHCGQEEDWRVQGGKETFGRYGDLSLKPTVVWWNAQPCGNATVRVDYHCLSVLSKAPTVLDALSEKLTPSETPLSPDLSGLGGLTKGGNETVYTGYRRSEGWRSEVEGLGESAGG